MKCTDDIAMSSSFFLLAMETRLVPENVQEPLIFPNHSDYKDGILSSPAWTESGRQFIKLPEEIFNRQNHPSTNGTV